MQRKCTKIETNERKIIHVNRAIIAHNAKNETNLPVYTIKIGKNPAIYTFAVDILGESRLNNTVESNRLSCGAKAWIETNAPLNLHGKYTWDQVKKMKRN